MEIFFYFFPNNSVQGRLSCPCGSELFIMSLLIKFLETCCLVTYRLLMMINLGQHAVKGFAGGLVTLAYYLIALGL